MQMKMFGDNLKICRLCKKSWAGKSKIPTVLVCLFLILSLALLPRNSVSAATLNPGSNITVCTGTVVQPGDASALYPQPIFYWTFTSAQSDYNDGVAPPASNTPVMAASTQSAVWIELTTDQSFATSLLETGWISTSANNYTLSTTTMAFGNRYYWRMKVRDSWNTVTDWVVGDSFATLRPSIIIKGGTMLKPGVRLR